MRGRLTGKKTGLGDARCTDCRSRRERLGFFSGKGREALDGEGGKRGKNVTNYRDSHRTWQSEGGEGWGTKETRVKRKRFWGKLYRVSGEAFST